MIHEFKKIIGTAINARNQGKKSVLATVVAVEGSSYRRPGVQMLLLENGKMTGAVSGGCVENEILRQAGSVFKTGEAKLMTYDGRYRLGCEGILYILLERFAPSGAFLEAFSHSLKNRTLFEMHSFYRKEEGVHPGMGSGVALSDGTILPVAEHGTLNPAAASLQTFSRKMAPCFRLIIIGAEHDAVQLCSLASMTGWEVTVVTAPSDPKTPEYFPGAFEVRAMASEALPALPVDKQTAMVLMTHNFAADLNYLIALKDTHPFYIGLLGPAKRRNRLLSQLTEQHPDVEETFLDAMYGPAGLNIGAETPQEIALSIISEILSVTRNQHPVSLREKAQGIHT